MDERQNRERMNGMMMCMNPMHANNMPWMTITRHASALIFYLYAATQWPGNTVPNVFSEDQRVFGYNLTSWLFTLLIWSALLYHYAVSWGRVEIIFKSGEVRARGWVVKSSKRLHRVLMSLTLACSLLTLAQSVTLEMVYTGFGNHNHPKFYLHLELLKIDQFISLTLFVYILFRVIFEPSGLKRYKRNLAKVKVLEVEENDNDLDIEVSVEECAICVSKWANRRLGCGHLLCCCCLMEISTNSYTSTLCPFCRAEIRKIRRLKVLSSDDVTFRDCCSTPSMDELVNRIANQEL